MQTTEISRVNYIELDDAAPATTAPALSPEQRIAQDDAALAKFGVATTAEIRTAHLNGAQAQGTNDGMLYDPGTRLQASGHEAVKSGRAKHDALPFAPEATYALADRLAAEHRSNDIVRLHDLRCSQDGKHIGIMGADGKVGRVAMPSERGWALVGGRVGEGLASYLPAGLPEVRKFAIDTHMARLVAQHADAVKQAQVEGSKPPRDPMISYATRARTANDNSPATRELYRVAGPRYSTALEAQNLLPEIAGALPADWKAETRYEKGRSRWSVEATMHARDIDVVGEAFKVGIRIGGDDTLGESVSTRIIVVRARCVNATPVRSVGRKTRFRHTSTNAVETIEAIRAEIDAMGDALNGFAERWGYAKRTQVADLTDRPGEVIADLCRRAGMRLPGGEAGRAAVAAAFAVEPGNTLDAAVNAITRAAHENAAWWSDLALSEEVEEVAANLLYARIA